MGGRLSASGAEAARRHADAVSMLRRAVLESPGVTPQALRVAAFAGAPLSEPAASYVTKVRDASYRVTDQGFEALRPAGLSEDAVFELTVAAALGAATSRLEDRLRAARVLHRIGYRLPAFLLR